MSDLYLSLSLDGGRLGEDDKKPLAVLFENSLKLNEKFREETGAVYFGFLGCHDEFAALHRFNFFADSYWLSKYLDALTILTDLIVSGVRIEAGVVPDVASSAPMSQHWSVSSVCPVQPH
jgi:hypothetical protein